MKRTTWVLVIIFVVVLGAAYVFQQHTMNTAASQTTPTATPEQNLLNIQSSALRSLRIEDAQGKTVALSRDASGKWTLTEPKPPATDTGRVEQAVSNLNGLLIMNKLVTPPPAQDTGLAKPAYTITLDTGSGQPQVVQIGTVTPTGTGYYAQLKGGPVVVVSKSSVDGLLDIFNTPPIQPTATLTPPAKTSAPGFTSGTPAPSGASIQGTQVIPATATP